MENQINLGDQNTQQIGRNPIDQPVQIPEKPKVNHLIIGIVVLVCFIVFGLGGYYLGKQSSRDITREIGGEIIPTPVTTETNPTANWKTYTDPKYSYSFKYPAQWVIDPPPIGNGILISDSQGPNEDQISLEISSTKSNAMAKSCKQIQQVLLDNVVASRCEFTQEISTERGVVYNPPIISKTVYIEALHNGLYYIISLTLDQTSDKFKILDQILSTFKFPNSPKNTITVKLYYHDSKLDPNTDFCEANNYTEKDILKTNTPIKDAINNLIRSDIFEKDDRFILKSINLKQDGTLMLEFPWIGGFTTGGSCRIGILTSQIEKTALQFSEVKKVTFEPEVFQP